MISGGKKIRKRSLGSGESRGRMRNGRLYVTRFIFLSDPPNLFFSKEIDRWMIGSQQDKEAIRGQGKTSKKWERKGEKKREIVFYLCVDTFMSVIDSKPEFKTSLFGIPTSPISL